MSDKYKSVSDLAENPIVVLAAELIRKPSVTPEDGGCQQLIASRLSAAGFECESMIFGDVTNLWARIGDQAPLLCFAGHTDVVPPGNQSLWKTDPFDPVIRDGNLTGRGAADMKGSLSAMIVAGERFVSTNPGFKGSLAFLITSDEEGIAENGTKKVLERLAARSEVIDWCLVGEPSSGDTLGDCVRVGRRGSLTGALSVKGVQGHVAYPHKADNPVRLFAPALEKLYATKWDDGNAAFPPTSFEIVHLESGLGVDNVIPGELHARFNFRYSTEWNHESLADKVEQVLNDYGFEYELQWILSGEPFLTNEGRLTQAVASAIKEIAGTEAEFSTGGGTSDGRFIAPTGADVIELGPRNTSIHKVNENVNVDDLVLLGTIYERVMEKLLLQ